MLKSAFISRHDLTTEQTALLTKADYSCNSVGDINAFSKNDTQTLVKALQKQNIDMVICVHPLLAMELSLYFKVGIFENSKRLDGSFKTSKLVIMDMVPRVSAWEYTSHYSRETYTLE